jgi:phosphatidylserine decarboxylase
MSEPPPVWDRIRVLHQYLLPQKSISRLVCRLTRKEGPVRVKNAAIRAFVRLFGIDLSEALQPNPHDYPSFNAFFTRALKPGTRPLPENPKLVACPVDGRISQLGAIDGTRVVQAKGHSYLVEALLGGDTGRAACFNGGHFATLYLSPRDYHRIHMPAAGLLTEMVHVPGRLFSVSPLTTRVIPGLFARNERVACLFQTDLGPMAMVLVGAINVGSIETVWAGRITPPYGRRVMVTRYPGAGEPQAVQLARGAEMGRFNMGSTVIVLFGPKAVDWHASLSAGSTVRLGQALATPAQPMAGATLSTN